MTGQGPPFLWPRPLLSHGCLSPPQSSILDLADIFTPTLALPSTHCSADPWDIPGGHAKLQEAPRLAPERPFLPSHLLASSFPKANSYWTSPSPPSASASSVTRAVVRDGGAQFVRDSRDVLFLLLVTLAFLPPALP